ncbi:protein CDC73 homolog [Rhodamnia argentea]|uniref:Protein CDC73 homolog n=1 Tax=Rhodamnia argentea TaxID=178133 RepID=A0A8B8Q8H2_9MYRT|nr:protein CDC73 homolog [Rhodamnia argentea]XP_030543396.1 protein CDC73 homolog [Rhodamnia argentea]XP_048135437.1 protein CDC73 homolog [Rhodamnia argentea]XP_048135441.1 protein CDC73 homolog [Rhodamnia argentea]
MDPLSALRDFTMRGDLDKIVRVGDEFRFGSDYSFPCAAETAYRSKQGNLYTLETLLFFVTHHHLKHTDYIQSARLHHLPTVTFIDRKPLLDYLQGKISSSDAIQLFPSSSSAVPSDVAMPDAAAAPAFSAELEGEAEEDAAAVDVMALIRAVERPLKDREAILECKNRDFYSVLVTSTRREEERQRIESQQRKDGLVAKSRLMGAEDRGLGFGEELGFGDSAIKPKLNLKGSKIGEGVPIILVPSAFQTLITIYNVKEFLEDGVFIPTDVKAKQMKGLKPDCITVQKKFSRDRVVTAYEVRDKPSALKSEDWDRVVAVFVLGKEWQFKDWPFKDHVEIFNRIIGFFMRFEDDSVESAKIVKQWNVKIISISKNKRHQDRAAALEVWEKLEDFVRSRSHS